MTEFTRRSALSTAAVLTAAALGSGSETSGARAAAPMSGAQAPGFYRYRVGGHEVTVVTDGVNRMPLADSFVANAGKDQVNAALEAAHLPRDTLTIPFSPIVVNTGAKLVVIDTGTGEGSLERTKGANGNFHRNLAAAGLDRAAVDTVVISHFHGDHINGLVTADGKPAFPNAEVLVPRAEWAFWMDEGEMSRAPAGQQDAFKNVRRVFDGLGRKVTPYEGGQEVAPGITAMATPGHTPGHTSYVIASGSERAFVQSDVTNVPYLFARNPGWHAAFDRDGPMAEATRRKVYDMLVAEKMPVQGFHYPFPGLAHVEKDGNGYRVVPAPWSPLL